MSARRAPPLHRVLEVGLVVVAALAPLPFGAVTGPGRTAIELAAAVLLLVWAVAVVREGVRLPSRAFLLPLVGALLLGLFQLVPVGGTVVELLALGSSDAVAAVGAPSETVSLSPARTASALRSGAAWVALALVAATVSARLGVARIATAFLAGAAFQSAYGILVLVSDDDRIWHVPKTYFLNCATGTFVNRNHFAHYVAIGTVLGAALLWRASRRASGTRSERRFGRRWASTVAVALALIVAAAGLALSLSRAGTALGFAGVALVLLAARRERSKTLVWLLVAMALAAVPLVQIGPDAFAERFSQLTEEASIEGGRLEVWGDTVRIVSAHPFLGVGLGAFVDAYPVFRSPSVRRYYTHAHNDYLEWLAETGWVGGVLMLPFAWRVSTRAVNGLGREHGSLGVGLAAAFGIVALHALVDFNLHIPANATAAAIVAGALEGLSCRSETSDS